MLTNTKFNNNVYIQNEDGTSNRPKNFSLTVFRRLLRFKNTRPLPLVALRPSDVRFFPQLESEILGK